MRVRIRHFNLVFFTGNHKVRTYTSLGEPLAIIGMSGTKNGQVSIFTYFLENLMFPAKLKFFFQFHLPNVLCISRSCFILVAEHEGSRIQVKNISVFGEKKKISHKINFYLLFA